MPKKVTVLMSPNGDVYRTSDRAEATRLVAAHGYVEMSSAEIRRPIAKPAAKPATTTKPASTD